MTTFDRFQPAGDNVLLRQVEPEEMVRGGIIIIKEAQEPQQVADVIAVGPACKFAQAGERVLYMKFAGKALKLDGVDYIVLPELDVLGKITGEVEAGVVR